MGHKGWKVSQMSAYGTLSLPPLFYQLFVQSVYKVCDFNMAIVKVINRELLALLELEKANN